MKAVAERAGRSLVHLALRWSLHQPGVTSVLAGARDARQAASNAESLDGEIADSMFDELTGISDRLIRQIPNTVNPYDHHP